MGRKAEEMGQILFQGLFSGGEQCPVLEAHHGTAGTQHFCADLFPAWGRRFPVARWPQRAGSGCVAGLAQTWLWEALCSESSALEGCVCSEFPTGFPTPARPYAHRQFASGAGANV